MTRTRAALAAAAVTAAATLTGCHMVPPIDHCNASKAPGTRITEATLVDAGSTTWALCESQTLWPPVIRCAWAIDYATHRHALRPACS